MRASRFKTAPIAVGLVVAAMLATAGVGAANALTLDDTVTTDLVVTETETSSEETVSEALPAQEEPPAEVPATDEVIPPAETDETEEVVAFAPTAYKVTTEEVETEHIEVTICHADNNADQPYGPKAITVDDDAVDGVGGSDHYGKHTGPLASTTAVAQALKDSHVQWGDIIPPLPGVHDGLNWTTEGQAIWANDCLVPTPPPTCIQDPVWSYTFDPATGSGDVTVTGGEEGEELCAPLYIRAAAWTYDLPASGSPSWPQTLYGTPGDTTVDAIGVFSYGPPQLDGCRQYDVYASFGGFGELELPAYLNGSHDPFEPAFLHETLSGFGPNPTWSYTSSEGCDPPVVEEPEVAAYTDCEDTEGDNSFVPITNPNDTPITVSVTIDGVTQDVIVPANDTVTVSFTLNEDEAAPVKVVFDGETIYESLLVRDCEEDQTQVFGEPSATAAEVCVPPGGGADVTYTLSFPAVELGENEFINPETLVYTDENGDLVEVEMNAGDPDVVVTVHFAEDSDVTVEYGVLGQELTQLVVDTDCVTPTGGLALTGDDLGPTLVALMAALLAAVVGAFMVVRGRKAKVVSAA